MTVVHAGREQRYHWIANTLQPIPVDPQAAQTYGALRASVRAAGRDPKPVDSIC